MVYRHNPCLSGGALEIFLEPSVPLPGSWVFGQAPIATALLRADRMFGLSVRASGSAEAGFPAGVQAVVVASHGNDEALVLERALSADVPYVGLVACRRRGAAVLESLAVDDDSRKRVRTPAGLDIGARTPPEVALSILAEIVEVLRQPRVTPEVRRSRSSRARQRWTPSAACRWPRSRRHCISTLRTDASTSAARAAATPTATTRPRTDAVLTGCVRGCPGLSKYCMVDFRPVDT